MNLSNHGNTHDKISAFHERMLDEIDDFAIIFLTTDGVINSWNKGAETIKGYREEDVLGKHFGMFYTPEDKQRDLPGFLLQHAAEVGKASHEGWRVRKNGSLFWANTTLTAVHDEHRRVIGFAKVTRDLTLRKLAEDALAEKNRQLERTNAELSSFAYIASHDLQEPLRKIQTFISRIADLEQGNLSEKSADVFKRIQNAGSRMQQLIDDLLSYSRMNSDTSKMESVNLQILVQEVMREMADSISEKKAVIHIVNILPVVQGIPFQLRQLFINLIGNALKFSKVNVPPEISIFCDEETDEMSRKVMHRIAVQDNGIGFEPEFKDKIFELFQRLHGRSDYAGTGIGLAICKKIAINHGGCINAESEPEHGATFNVFLPKQAAH